MVFADQTPPGVPQEGQKRMRLPSIAKRVLMPCLQGMRTRLDLLQTLLTWCHTSQRDWVLHTWSRKETQYFFLSCCRRSVRC
ncbi:hypothetical protein E2C01_071375 [Portunus trituberculatus]|uniref:Uncharacterized protein n=1 Tax=Portunus trituberculatus TaxID=210409 RepID=A0A5B7I7U2_PORTR|nr:hypothetical protein [Portunus trituberculatus]